MVYVFMEYAKNLDFKMEIDSKVPSVFVDLTGIFLLFFSDNISSEKTEHYIIIDDVV